MHILLLCGALLLTSAYSLADELSESFCNSRRLISRTPGIKPKIDINHPPYSNPSFEKYCYAYAKKLTRIATGHDDNLEEAKGVFETILIINPESVYPHMGLAEIQIRKHQLNIHQTSLYFAYREALVASRIQPEISDAFVLLGRIALLLNCNLCAEIYARKAQDLGNSSAELAMLLSSLFMQKNNFHDAKAVLTNALSQPSSIITSEIHLDLYLSLASLNAFQNNFTEAEVALNNAISLDPHNTEPYLAKAEFLLFWTGNSKEAAKTASKAYQIKPTISAKRIQSFSEYLTWANNYFIGNKSIDIKRTMQTSFLSPDEVFIHSARYIGLSKITEAMLNTKLINNIDSQDSQGNTALITANIGNNSYLSQLIIKQHANINAQNMKGERALTFSVLNDNQNAVIALIKAGAEVNFTDINGNSPLSIAFFRQNKHIFNLLIEHGASIQPLYEIAKKMEIKDIEKLVENLRPVAI